MLFDNLTIINYERKTLPTFAGMSFPHKFKAARRYRFSLLFLGYYITSFGQQFVGCSFYLLWNVHVSICIYKQLYAYVHTAIVIYTYICISKCSQMRCIKWRHCRLHTNIAITSIFLDFNWILFNQFIWVIRRIFSYITGLNKKC